MIGAPRCRAHLIRGWQDDQNGDVLVELNDLLHVELVVGGVLRIEAQVLKEELQTRQKELLQ